MKVEIVRPQGYEPGCWTVAISLDSATHARLRGQVAFPLPKLKMRNIIADEGFRVAVPAQAGVEIFGQIRDGSFRGHVYSDGVEERLNPTPIDAVRSAIETSVQHVLRHLLPEDSL